MPRNELDKRTYKICEAVKLGLDTYYLEPNKPIQLTEKDRALSAKVIPALPEGFTRMSESFDFSIWRNKARP